MKFDIIINKAEIHSTDNYDVMFSANLYDCIPSDKLEKYICELFDIITLAPENISCYNVSIVSFNSQTKNIEFYAEYIERI